MLVKLKNKIEALFQTKDKKDAFNRFFYIAFDLFAKFLCIVIHFNNHTIIHVITAVK